MQNEIRITSLPENNLKSKIKKRPRGLKWVGIITIGVTFVVCGAVAQAQQAKKV